MWKPYAYRLPAWGFPPDLPRFLVVIRGAFGDSASEGPWTGTHLNFPAFVMLLPDDFGIALICPDCRRPLARIDHYYICSDGECRRAYAIVDQIPKLLVDDSQVLEPADWRSRLESRPATADATSC